MHHRKSVPLAIKSADDESGTFTGLASVFDNVDAHGDIVRRGAFAKSVAAGEPIPLQWEHGGGADPRLYVGDVVSAVETAEGLLVTGRFDLDTEHGMAAYRNVKGRRVSGLSIGYRINHSTKNAAGHHELTDLELLEVSVVARGANDRALILAAKSADRREILRERVARAQLLTEGQTTVTQPKADKAATDDQFTKGREEQLAAARQIVELARELERELTDEEAEQVEKHLAAAEQHTKAVAESVRTAAIFAKLDAMAASTAGGAASAASGAAAGERLAFTKGMAAAAATKIRGDGVHQKAVAPSGAMVVSQEFAADPVALGKPATSLLSVLPVKIHASPQFSYLRQSVRTNNAAVVAEGAVKPTSVYSVTQVEDQLDVIAHLSEAVPRYWLSDNDALGAWLTNELVYGLMVAVESAALATIAGTSGVQTNAYATSQLVTLRKSLTKLEAQGYDPAAFILHPSDWESVELAVSSTNAIEHMGIPFDPVGRRLYGAPVVVTNAQTAGVAHTLAEGAAGIDTDQQGVLVQWSETSNADDWSRNMIRARVEARFAASVFSPLGVVASDLTAA